MYWCQSLHITNKDRYQNNEHLSGMVLDILNQDTAADNK